MIWLADVADEPYAYLRTTGRVTGNSNAGVAGGGAIYGLAIFGAWLFSWQQAETFWARARA